MDVLDDERKLGWRVMRWVFLYLFLGWKSLCLLVSTTVLPLLCLVRLSVVGEGRFSVILHGRVHYGDANS